MPVPVRVRPSVPLPRSVTVAPGTLDPLVQVQILARQPTIVDMHADRATATSACDRPGRTVRLVARGPRASPKPAAVESIRLSRNSRASASSGDVARSCVPITSCTHLGPLPPTALQNPSSSPTGHDPQAYFLQLLAKLPESLTRIAGRNRPISGSLHSAPRRHVLERCFDLALGPPRKRAFGRNLGQRVLNPCLDGTCVHRRISMLDRRLHDPYLRAHCWTSRRRGPSTSRSSGCSSRNTSISAITSVGTPRDDIARAWIAMRSLPLAWTKSTSG